MYPCASASRMSAESVDIGIGGGGSAADEDFEDDGGVDVRESERAVYIS